VADDRAALAGVPHLTHGVGLLNPDPRLLEPVAPAVDALYAEWGIRSGFDWLVSAAFIDICPPRLRSGRPNPFAAIVPMRPRQPAPLLDEPLPAAVCRLPYERTIHVTLGTVVNHTAGLLEAVLEGLRDEPLNLVVTVGPDRDPDELGPLPKHVVAARYIPHALVLPSCAAGQRGSEFSDVVHDQIGLPALDHRRQITNPLPSGNVHEHPGHDRQQALRGRQPVGARMTIQIAPLRGRLG
jgi:hypothetical protein